MFAAGFRGARAVQIITHSVSMWEEWVAPAVMSDEGEVKVSRAAPANKEETRIFLGRMLSSIRQSILPPLRSFSTTFHGSEPSLVVPFVLRL